MILAPTPTAAEIVVAPGPGRLMKALMDLVPSRGPGDEPREHASWAMRLAIHERSCSNPRSTVHYFMVEVRYLQPWRR